jgi:hypothetical protein
VLNATAPEPWNGGRDGSGGTLADGPEAAAVARFSCVRKPVLVIGTEASSIPSDFVGISVGGDRRERNDEENPRRQETNEGRSSTL